jgi:hypothetical protein
LAKAAIYAHQRVKTTGVQPFPWSVPLRPFRAVCPARVATLFYKIFLWFVSIDQLEKK